MNKITLYPGIPICRVPATILLIMRLTTFIFILSLTQVSAASFGQTMNYKRQTAKIIDVFNEIEKQTGYHIFYPDGIIDVHEKRKVEFKNEQISTVLEKVLKGYAVQFKIDDRNIFIKSKEGLLNSGIFSAFFNIDVRGRILNKSGEPIGGVTVKIKGSSQSTSTDENGRYYFANVSETAVLVISSMGYATRELPVKANMADVVLEESIKELEAVSVTASTGYQKISKDRATGSYDFVGQDVLSHRPVSNLSSALQGTVAGLQAKENADGSTSFLLRGAGTMNATTNQPLAVTQPLVVVDGFAIQGFDFANINQNDVESITVLKDAAALSIWGSRGTNGVIVIQTKRPQVGRSNLNVQAFTRVSDRIDLDQVLKQARSADHIRYERLAFDRNFLFSPYAGGLQEIMKPLTLAQEQLFAFKNGSITEAQLNTELARLSGIDNRSQISEELMQRAIVNQANLSLSGGTERLRTGASLLYEKSKDGFKYKGYDRFVLNVNNDFAAAKFLTLNFGVNVGYRKNDLSGANVSELEGLSPYELLLNEDGSYGTNLRNLNRAELAKLPLSKFPYQDWTYNLLREVRGRSLSNETISARFQGGLNAKIVSGLTFDGKVQFEKRKVTARAAYNEETFEVRNLVNNYLEYNDATKTVGRVFLPKGGILRSTQGIYDDLGLREGDYEGLTLRGQFNYEKSIGSKHQISALVGTEFVDEQTTGQRNPTAFGYYPERNQIAVPPYGYGSALNPLRTFISPTAAATIPATTTNTDGGNTVLSWRANRLASFYANASYTYDGKYVLSGSARSDASNFISSDPKLRWNPLWHVGLMWNMGKEEFMNAQTWIDRLSLRLTYGSTGFPNQSVSTQTLVTMGTSPSAITNTIIGTLGTPGNALLRWERTYSTNLAVDFSLFDGKLFGKLEGYNKDGRDIVGNISLAAVTGTTSARVNNAGISNRGIEVTLGTKVDLSADATYSTNVTYAYNRNKVTKLYFPALRAFEMISGQYVEGRPVGAVYSYNYAGMIDGVPHVEGVNQLPSTMNAVVLHNTGLGLNFLRYEGTMIPPHTLGWINNFRYKNFNLMTVVTGTMGGVFRRPTFNYSSVVGSSKTSVDRFVADVFAGNQNIPDFPKVNETNSYLWDRYVPNLHDLVESSSFIELKEINLEYSLPKTLAGKVSLSNIRVFAQARNLGLLYTNNSEGYHPDWLPGTNRPVRNYTLGLNLQF